MYIKKGFTLIEMLIVIVVIGILAGAMVPRVINAKDYANDSVRMNYTQGIFSAILQYNIDNSDYPSIDAGAKIGNCNCATLADGLGDSLINYGYPKTALPRDPTVDQSYKFCGETIEGGQFLYCKLGDGILLVSHVERNSGNASISDFENAEITEESKRVDITQKLSISSGDLYIYCGA